MSRRTHDGDPKITAEFHRRREGRSVSTLAAHLIDPEHAAQTLLEELGPAACRRLARALLDIAQGVDR